MDDQLVLPFVYSSKHEHLLSESTEPTQRINGHIAVIASPPDARYAPLAAGGPRTFDAVRALVFQVGSAAIDKVSHRDMQ